MTRRSKLILAVWFTVSGLWPLVPLDIHSGGQSFPTPPGASTYSSALIADWIVHALGLVALVVMALQPKEEER
jgi:hypothetical protein